MGNTVSNLVFAKPIINEISYGDVLPKDVGALKPWDSVHVDLMGQYTKEWHTNSNSTKVDWGDFYRPNHWGVKVA